MSDKDKDNDFKEEIKEEKKGDNRLRAIIAMLITGPMGAGCSIAYKMGSIYGVTPMEFQIFRGVF